jgi:hypothetical protein
MVNSDDAQLYTIEGFAAALIIVITAFLVMNATSVYTAGDTHINDMQLEALGTDALKMMDTPVKSGDGFEFRPMIQLTACADHRIVDGASVARFLDELKSTLENPYLLI